jgi:hypothetical protein
MLLFVVWERASQGCDLSRRGAGRMKLKDWRDVLMTDLPEMSPVTQEVIDLARTQGRRYRGSMRISTCSVWPDEEYEKRRAKILSTPLP